MRVLRVLSQRVRSLFCGAKADAELARELAFHLEQLTRENMNSGMEPVTAKLAAQRTLGNVAQIEEQCRDHRRIRWLTDLLKDFVYAWRTLASSPGFTSLAVVTLALGLGASIAFYALSEAVLLRSLPYFEPERLVRIADVYGQYTNTPVGQENFRDWRASNTVFERMAFAEATKSTLTGYGEAERIQGLSVSEGFFELLGVQPELGRWFRPEEQRAGAECVAMVSHAFWARRLGARSESVGGAIILDNRPCRVTGVMPESFRFNVRGVPEFWKPVGEVTHSRLEHGYQAYARLRRGVSVAAAQTQMSQIADRLAHTYPENAGWGVQVKGMRAELLREVRSVLLIFAAAVLIVVLVACSNVASLLLARGIGRSREIAVRIALGAGRARVVRLLLTESLLLSGMSAVLGVPLALCLLRLVISAAPPELQLGDTVSVSAFLVLFAVGLVLCTGLLAGLWPAIAGSRASIEGALRENGGALVARKRQVRSLDVLVVMEVALSVVLLAFTGLLAKSFTHLLETNLGYRTDHVLTFQLPLAASRYRTPTAYLQFWDTLLPRLAAVPGVLSAAAADSIPLGETYNGAPVEVEAHSKRGKWGDAVARGAIVTPEYFRTMGIGLRVGRTFTAGDTPRAEPVIIVNETFVRRLLPNRPPLGTRVRIGSAPWARIVGVIGDELCFGPAQPKPEAEAYMPHTLAAPFLQFVAIHTAVPEESVIAEARRIVRQIDPGLPFTQVRTMRQSVDLSIPPVRQMMTLVAGFGIVTLVMSVMGLSGIMLYTVSRRRREIGLRIALGARPADISREVLGSAARLVAVGSAIGVLAALASGRLLESLLFGVQWYDPGTLVAAPAALTLVALAVCLIPSRRAATVEPMEALREE